MTDYLTQFIAQYQPITQFVWLDSVILVAIMLLVSLIVDKIDRRILINLLHRLLGKTAPKTLDLLEKHQALAKIAAVIPLLIISSFSPVALSAYQALSGIVVTVCNIAILMKMASFIFALLDVTLDVARERGLNKKLPIKSINQLIKLFVFLVVAVISISTVLGKSPLYFLSGLGAMTAVVLLVFKDTILGFVAGVQLAANQMVSRGDWIEMPKYGADGEVLEVALTTVQVQNWDKTITMIPTYALISDSFKNWRGMEQAGGRRIKRSIRLDVNSIGFMDQSLIEHLQKIDSISDYLVEKQNEINEQNQQLASDLTVNANGRKLTNVGTFRAYLEYYLQNHPMVSQEMTLIVRQLPADENGLPIELYLFCTDIRWAAYEAIQADLFDHIYAVLPEFNLRAFQSPSGYDWRQQ
ncbi:mechanosensitive ion channel family protein [Psychrobium sp. nBUS_13]|uniref:mechanosensitive ion channel family protein n=1 Tax=Psychrobium sp. nBUS_13 TaxID=3395319 RepID=UPI003EBF365A